MRLYTYATASLMALTTVAQADTHQSYSTMIADFGLAETANQLSAKPAPTTSDQFALGGVQFLRAVERTLQTRYAYGVNGKISEILDVPLMRLPIFDNPAPQPFTPDVIDALFTQALQDFDAAITALDTIADTADVAVTLNTDDLWFDVNMNTIRDPGEGFFDIRSGDLDRNLTEDTSLTIQFDTADAAWLSAYAHLLSGVSETVLALDTTEAIITVMTGAAQLKAVTPKDKATRRWFSYDDETFADAIAIGVRAVEGQPDATRTRAAHAHFLGMIADNKTFWARVARETDDNMEWIPNKNQSSALPITFPADTGQRWQAVLADAEAVLRGDALIPHWRLGENAGLNLAKLMQDPPEIDIIGIIQGHTIAPYAERGRVIDRRNMRAFEQLMGGDAPLFMMILN